LARGRACYRTSNPIARVAFLVRSPCQRKTSSPRPSPPGEEREKSRLRFALWLRFALLLVLSLLLPVCGHAALSGQRVLLLSIDGMHALDLARFVNNNPNSTLAGLMSNAVNYTTAS